MSNQESPDDDDASTAADPQLGETPAANPDATADREHSTAPSDTADADSLRELEEVVAQVEVLREENRRLRAEYVRAHQSAYRRAALALLVFGGLAAGGGLVFPGLRATLFGLAGIGGFIAILVYYLTPQRVATATVGERADATRAQLEAAISADLGLQDTYVYVPTLADDPVGGAARLFVPLHTTYTVPEPEALGSVFVVDSADQTRGVSLPPTGALLLAECRQTMIDDLATTPDALLEQLTEALVAGFELAGDAVADVDATDGTATVGVRDSTFGAVDRFDHPLPSFVATGLAVGLQTPVERAVITTESADFDYVLTYTWDADAGETEVAETATQ